MCPVGHELVRKTAVFAVEVVLEPADVALFVAFGRMRLPLLLHEIRQQVLQFGGQVAGDLQRLCDQVLIQGKVDRALGRIDVVGRLHGGGFRMGRAHPMRMWGGSQAGCSIPASLWRARGNDRIARRVQFDFI